MHVMYLFLWCKLVDLRKKHGMWKSTVGINALELNIYLVYVVLFYFFINIEIIFDHTFSGRCFFFSFFFHTIFTQRRLNHIQISLINNYELMDNKH